MDTLKNTHIGSIIKEKLAEKSMSIAEFARKINRERTAVYDIFERKSLDTELLIKIGNILDYDFIHEVYFQNAKTAASKILIAIEIDKNDLDKLNLSEQFSRLVKHEK